MQKRHLYKCQNSVNNLRGLRPESWIWGCEDSQVRRQRVERVIRVLVRSRIWPLCHFETQLSTVFNFRQCIPYDVVKRQVCVCIPSSLSVDCEVCISGTHSDLETQSHPRIHTKWGVVFTLKRRPGLSLLAGLLPFFSSELKQNDLEQTVNNEVFNKSCAKACQQVVYHFTVSPQYFSQDNNRLRVQYSF